MMKKNLSILSMVIHLAVFAQENPEPKNKDLDELNLNDISQQAIKDYRQKLKFDYKDYKTAKFKAWYIVKSDTLIYSGSVENNLMNYKINYDNYHQKTAAGFEYFLKSYLRAIKSQRMILTNRFMYPDLYCRKMAENDYVFSVIKKKDKKSYGVNDKAFDMPVSLNEQGEVKRFSSLGYDNLDQKNSQNLYDAKQKTVVEMITENGRTRFLSSEGSGRGEAGKLAKISLTFD